MPWASEPVTLFCDTQGTHHGDQFCHPNLTPTLLPPEAVCELPRTTCSECGGWQSSRLGILLDRAHTSFTTLDDDHSNVTYTRWDELGIMLGRHAKRNAWSPHSPTETAALEAEASDAAERIAERSRRGLDTRILWRAVGAQGVRVAVNADEALDFTGWVVGMRIASPDGRRRPNARFNDALEQELTKPETTLIAIAGNPGRNPLEWGLPTEVAFLAWTINAGENRTALANVPLVVAAGLPHVSRSVDIGIATTPETNQSVLETVAVLWQEAPRHYPGRPTLDEVLSTARNV